MKKWIDKVMAALQDSGGQLLRQKLTGEIQGQLMTETKTNQGDAETG